MGSSRLTKKRKQEHMKLLNLQARAAGVIALMAATLPACSLWTDDTPPCATDPEVSTVVNFVYDYNLSGADLLNQHVGSIYLYIFDNNGTFLQRHSLHRSQMPAGAPFTLSFTESQLPAGNYQMVAVAESDPVGYNHTYVDASTTPGFTLQTEMIPGVSKIDDYILKLDRDDDDNVDYGIVNYQDAYGDTQTMITHLFTTKPDEVQYVKIDKITVDPETPEGEVPDKIVNEVTIPLMRITNSLEVSLLNQRFNSGTDPDEYRIVVDFPNGNGTIDFTGATQPAEELYYLAIWKNTVPYTPQGRGADDTDYAIQGTFGLSRLQVADQSSLQIRDPEPPYEVIDQIPNLSDFLADYFQHGFDDPQEFLDRNYEFAIEVEIDDYGKIQTVAVGVDILGWGRRVQIADL